MVIKSRRMIDNMGEKRNSCKILDNLMGNLETDGKIEESENMDWNHPAHVMTIGRLMSTW